MAFTVAIVGRPNVGKSTLFNRLVGKRAALVAPVPGVTRDRREGDARIGPLRFRAIDTAGLEEAAPATLSGRMMAQTERALAESDVVLFLVDGRAGLTPADFFFAKRLRRSGAPVVLAANKCEGGAGEGGIAEAHALGMGEPIALSAEHGDGMAELYDALSPFAPDDGPEREEEDRLLRLAIVGRPNVGKSTLLNRLIGDARVIVGPEPGLTRDSIAVRWDYEGRTVELADTAGLRRRAKVDAALEKLSAADAGRTLGRAAVALTVLDATEPVGRQDLAIAARAVEEGRAVVVVVNKADLSADRAACARAVRERLDTALPQARGVDAILCSALTGAGTERIMPAVLAAFERWNRRIPTSPLNRWLADARTRHPPPRAAGGQVKVRYITQVKARPPTFALFVNRPAGLPESYRRYLVNGLREEFGFAGTPLRLMLRGGENPYAPRAS